MPQSSLDATAFARSIHAVVVGVDDYAQVSAPDRLAPLPGCPTGARSLQAALVSPKLCRLPPAQAVCLTDAGATGKPAILAALAAAAGLAGPGDALFFYFAGHGLQVGGDFVLAASGASAAAEPAACISARDLVTALEGTRARGVLFVLDCCGGAALAESAPFMFSALGDRFDYRIVFSASERGQSSLMLEGGSPFTTLLVEALSGGLPRMGPLGEIWFRDLFDHIVKRMEALFEGPLRNLKVQRPIALSAYRKDPLVFINSDASLRSIELNLDRYSKRDLRRRLGIAAAGAAGLLCCLVLALWTWQDQHRYAEVMAADGALGLAEGYPGWAWLGYPHAIWQLKAEAADVDGSSELGRSGHLVMSKGMDPFEEVLGQLTDLGRAKVLAQSSQPARAAAAARQAIRAENSVRGPVTLNAKDIIASVAAQAEVGDLEALSRDLPPEVATGALRALVAIDAGLAARLLLGEDGPPPSRFDETVVLPEFPAGCAPDVARWVEERMGSRTAFSNAAADMLLRTRCVPSALAGPVNWSSLSPSQARLRRELAPQSLAGAAAGFRAFVGGLTSDGRDPLAIGQDLGRALDGVVALDLPDLGCDEGVTGLILSATAGERGPDEDVKASFARYLLRYCRSSRFGLDVSDEGDPRFGVAGGPTFSVSSSVLEGADIDAMAGWSPSVLARVAASQAGRASRANEKAGYVPFLAPDDLGWGLVGRLATEDDEALQSAALLWVFRHAPAKLATFIRAHDDVLSDDAILDVMAIAAADDEVFAGVRGVVDGTAKRLALKDRWAVLWGTPDEALTHLRSPVLKTRVATLECLAYRGDLEALRTALAADRPPPTGYLVAGVDRAIRERRGFAADLAAVPAADVAWRASLFWTRSRGGRLFVEARIGRLLP